MIKKIILTVLLFAIIPFFQPLQAESPPQEQLIRVGISSNDFSQLVYPSTTVSADNEFYIKDLYSQKILINASPAASYKITVDSNGFNIYAGGKKIHSSLFGPLEVMAPHGHVQLLDIKRKGKTPSYRGSVQVVRAPSSNNLLTTTNVLHLDEYLKGVVPNELGPGFGVEALKAQAIAARNYALRPREKFYDHFDICDSVMCQVYFGYGTETPLTNQAVDETAGITALYDGDIITALYSSTAGGFTESYENAFSDPISGDFPAKPIPYLTARHDFDQLKDLSAECDARNFIKSKPESFDVRSSYFRWQRTWPRVDFEREVNANLRKFSASSATAKFIKPDFKKGDCLGKLTDVKVLRRGISGKAMEVQVIGTGGFWTVQKELLIRRVFTHQGKALPSANIVIDRGTDSAGNIVNITMNGAGFGHGVGMSQYGASYMGTHGYKFYDILQHYYKGTALGTIPVFLSGGETLGPIKQTFYSYNGNGVLNIENYGASKIELVLNGKKITLTNQIKGREKVNLDITEFVKQGKNELIYYPLDPTFDQGMAAKVWIEILRARC